LSIKDITAGLEGSGEGRVGTAPFFILRFITNVAKHFVGCKSKSCEVVIKFQEGIPKAAIKREKGIETFNIISASFHFLDINSIIPIYMKGEEDGL
jgi:hypothetical protein